MKKKRKIKLIDIWNYLLGNYRYKLYYSSLRDTLIRKHIREQIACRIESMDRECYNNGVCKECGCKTTALQMCNKACEGGCYPKMLNKKDWSLIYKYRTYVYTSNRDTWILDENDKFINLKNVLRHGKMER